MSALPSATARRATAPRRAAGAARPRRRPQLRVVGPPRHTARYVVAVLVLGAAGVFGIVSLSALAAESAFHARTLEREVEALTLRYDELTAEVARLESPARVRAVAVDELGMVPAESAAYLVVDGPLDGPGEQAPVDGEEAPEVHRLADPPRPVPGAGE